MSHKISITILRKLTEMIHGQQVSAGSAKNQIFFELLVANGVLASITKKSRTKFYCKHVGNLKNYLNIQFGILDLETELKQREVKPSTRSEVLQANANEKSSRVKPFQGFLIYTPDQLEVRINQQNITLSQPVGTSLLIHDWQQFEIPPYCQVIIVENFENFKQLDQQLNLFSAKARLFVFRFYDKHQSLISWLQSIPNSVLYFGDWDFGGIKIFMSEFYQKLPQSCVFFVPHNLPKLLQEKGSRLRYHQQLGILSAAYYQKLPAMVHLANLFHQHKSVLAQEVLIPQ